MSTMVERVARAIYFRADDQGDKAWNHCQSWHRDIAREQARAAIEAMREPTDAMANAAWAKIGEDGDADVAVIYANMIDAALNEQEQGR